MNPPRISLQLVLDVLSQRHQISFVKRGDGEEACMNGEPGGNCDGHPYTPELGLKLREAFDFLASKPNVYISRFEDQTEYNTFLHRTDNNLQSLHDFYLGIRNLGRRKVFVGPQRLVRAAMMLRAEFVTVPLVNAYDSYDEIARACRWRSTPNTLMMFCCGMPAKPLIADMFKFRDGSELSCLDLGSAFDPVFVGQTRTVQAAQRDLLALYSDLL